jgi:hypothetical protein
MNLLTISEMNEMHRLSYEGEFERSYEAGQCARKAWEMNLLAIAALKEILTLCDCRVDVEKIRGNGKLSTFRCDAWQFGNFQLIRGAGPFEKGFIHGWHGH